MGPLREAAGGPGAGSRVGESERRLWLRLRRLFRVLACCHLGTCLSRGFLRGYRRCRPPPAVPYAQGKGDLQGQRAVSHLVLCKGILPPGRSHLQSIFPVWVRSYYCILSRG